VKGTTDPPVPQVLWTGITPSLIWIEIRYPGTDLVLLSFDLSRPLDRVVVEHALAERGLCIRSGKTNTPVTIEWPESAQEGASLVYTIWSLKNSCHEKT
jgi:hypothetical protein